MITDKPKNRNDKSLGYTLIELLLAVAVGAVVIAGVYASYVVVSRQHTVLSAYAEVQEAGIPTLRYISKDLLMAGYRAVDDELESVFGAINIPINITDSGNACCDTLQIIYDEDINTRYRITYFIAPRNDPDRNALYMDRETWDGAAWNSNIDDSLVSDYIEDFQVVVSETNGSGQPTLIDLSMIFRNKKPLQRPAFDYDKPDYDVGNYAFSANDSYHRDEFNATLNIKNLRNEIY